MLLLVACGGEDDVAGESATTAPPDTAAPDVPVSGGDADPSQVLAGEDESAAEAPSDASDPEGSDTVADSDTTLPQESAPDDPNLPERVPTSTGAPVTGEVVGSVLSSIKSDLAARTGADESAMVLIRGEEVIWNDGSLGCPVPGEIYTQAPVSGYWVVIEHGGTQYDYRANDEGFFKLCDGGLLPPGNPSG